MILYIRVSSLSQNIDRQISDMYKMGLTKKCIYIDKESGKDFNRKNYQRLFKKLKANDVLVIKSIDRLGRNYNMILEEWQKITKIIRANIMVIDMPILNTTNKDENLIDNFISDVVLQILSFVAQTERENIMQRQAEGIKLAMQRGVKFGRPKVKIPNNFADIVKKYKNKEISNIEACKILGLKRGTFYRYIRQM